MSNRERWVIYPLLIWSLGMGFRSQYAHLFEQSNLEVRQIRLMDEKGDLRMLLKAEAADGGALSLIDAEGATTIELKENGGLVPVVR